MTQTVLVTGAAGFIGAHVAARLRRAGLHVFGCDNFNDYYDPALKTARVGALLTPLGVPCQQVELADANAVRDLFQRTCPEIVVHLAAQAGVRYSITHPEPYLQSNLVAFGHVLEGARHSGLSHLVYASSSSVYGDRANPPFRESRADRFTGLALRRNQEGQRTDGTGVQPPLWSARDWAAVLHRVWPMGAAGHGVLQFR